MSMSSSISPPQDSKPLDQPGGKKPAAKRKPHRKSRTGCKQCRASRVKCDESKPACGYCVRHSVQCSYLSTEPNLVPAISGLSLQGDASRRASSSRAASGSPLSDSGAPALCNHLHMRDLELLMQYNTSTGPSIATMNPANGPIWSTSVPREALENPFLMHGIFAISAVHLAHIHRNDPVRHLQYAQLAEKHEGIALPLYRAQAVNITEKNCASVFAFSALVVVYAMASPSYSTGLFSPTSSADGLPRWLHLLRGVDAITRPRLHMFLGHDLAPLIDLDRFQNRILEPSDDLHISILDSLFSVPVGCDPQRLQDLTVYQEALACLRNSFTHPTDPLLPAKPIPYVWFTMVPDKYLKLLSQRRPEALVLLAYQCVGLKRLEPEWFIDGVADSLMRSVLENLGHDWSYWIQWPLEQMGLKPMDPFV